MHNVRHWACSDERYGANQLWEKKEKMITPFFTYKSIQIKVDQHYFIHIFISRTFHSMED
ncbi:MAG: hypothetical protein DRO88_07570 [Promethearchaeia archaeon]|nr:MAG: hypothetical protein DRO88_07570 [Candidatus Lokiarchaeia archaeon]